MTRLRRHLAATSGERGVAMVTVLFVGAVLTAVSSTAAFMSIQEFRASADDRRAAEALAFGEAGLDRFIVELRRGKITWADIRRAGCETDPLTLPPGKVTAEGWYDVELVVYNPSPASGEPGDRFPPASCTNQTRTTNARQPHHFAITSTGSHPAAKRVVRQVIEIGVLELPVGIYANQIDCNGTPNFVGISMITPGDVRGREKCGFSGIDPYYFLSDFWPGESGTTHIPAGVHAVGKITLKQAQGNSAQEKLVTEHAEGKPLNCDANDQQGTSDQSMWDQSGQGGSLAGFAACPNWTVPQAGLEGPPPTSLFTDADRERVTPKPELTDQDYLMLRDSAKQYGLHCLIQVDSTGKTTSFSCTKAGQAWTPQMNANGDVKITQDDVDDPPEGTVARNFVAYIEFEGGRGTVIWDAADVKADDGSICNATNPDINRSVVAITRNGDMKVEGNVETNGAIIIPEGKIDVAGTMTHNGTIIADAFDNKGTATFQVNECWVANMPGPFLDITPSRWGEIDR